MFRKKDRRLKKFQITVTDAEYRFLLNSLNEYRNRLLAEGRYTDGLDETILAVMYKN